MATKKPSESEDEYFARQEAEKTRQLAVKKQKELKQSERDELKKKHHMRCPKDGMELSTITFKNVQIDRCHTCNGTWLDAGELEQLAGKEPGILKKVIAVFK
jgi:uncharacterized protein